MSELIKKYVVSPNNMFVPIGLVVSIIGSVLFFVNTVNDFKANINDRFGRLENRIDLINDSLKSHYTSDWNAFQMKIWSFQLERENTSLKVPDPLVVKRETN